MTTFSNRFSFTRTSTGSVRLLGLLLTSLASGCGGLFGAALPTPSTTAGKDSVTIGIAVAVPSSVITINAGDTTTLRWSDIATIPGTTVRLQAQRVATSGNSVLADAFTGPVIFLVGNGTPGSGRDALADGDSDTFHWDTTGVRKGVYVITATIEAPDGSSKTAVSASVPLNTSGVINITSTQIAPTLTFTNPGANDVALTTGNTTNITWTDNGNEDATAQLTLGLDPDDDHNNGNEIFLVSNQVLSTDGDTGSFTFNFLDQDGNTVPDGTYRVFARLDDTINDIVTVSATGRLVLNP